MRARPRLRLGKRSLVGLALLAALGGLGIASVSVYRYFDSATEAAPVVRELSSRHRIDPGGIYDRYYGPSSLPRTLFLPGVFEESTIDAPLRDSAYRIMIDRIGVNASVYTYGLDANLVPEVPLNGADVAWYNFSDRPGTGSNAVFGGHVTWGGRAVFYDLDDVQVGDTITLRGDNGVELAYAVSETFLVDTDDPNSLSVMHPTDKDIITLITCGGSFFYTGNSVARGDYTHRRIVRATFTAMTPQAPAGG